MRDRHSNPGATDLQFEPGSHRSASLQTPHVRLAPLPVTTGQLKRELKARGAEPPEDATRDAMREMLLGLLSEEHI